LNECTSQEREGDLDAQTGACRVGERRILEVAEKYGEGRLHALIDSCSITPSGWCRQNCEKFRLESSAPKTGSTTMT
jgi:N-methylhydantoinase B/oxoprolinase/acetone carboxylase alpha subunit